MAEWTVDRANIKSTVDGNYILYRNRPFVREDNIICYGCLQESYYLKMTVLTEKEYKGRNIADQIYVQLIKTADNSVTKETIKSGMYNALDVGIAWLDRYTLI